jgi:dual specificity phosphatase 3
MSYDYSRATERLFVGAQIGSAADVAELKRAGVTHVIDANIDDESGLFPPLAGIALLPCPTPDDGAAKPAAWFEPVINFAIRALGRPGNIVLCHCFAGINRGPSLAYAILRAQDFGPVGALLVIRTARPATVGGIRYAGDAERALAELGWIKGA